MTFEEIFYNKEEKPLDRIVEGYSHTSIFRKIAFVGDSLSSGEFQIRDKDGNWTYHDMYKYSWGQFIARKNGLTAYNFSRGGMTAKEYIESFGEERGFWDADKACQAYVIALGVNDIYNKDMEIGSIDDIDKDDYRKNKPTYTGYYAAIISRYKEISPDAKFFFVTFPNEPQRDAEKTQKMVKVLYDLAEHFDNSYVIDLYKYGPVYDENFREMFFLKGGHRTPSGYIVNALLVDSYIDYIVRHNHRDFDYVGFIGTDISYEEICKYGQKYN